MKLKNDLFIEVAKGTAHERIPVWLPQPVVPGNPGWQLDIEIADGIDNMYADPAYAVKYALETIKMYNPDAVCLFTDAWVVARSLDVAYRTNANMEPVFNNTPEGNEVILSHPFKDQVFQNTFETIKQVKKAIKSKVPIVARMAAPWSLFARMNQSDRAGSERSLLYRQHAASSELMESITDASVKLLQLIVKAGADVVMIVDSDADKLNMQLYQEYGIPALEILCNSTYQIPKIIEASGAYQSREELAKLNCQVLAIGWEMHVKESRQIIGPFKTLQGNLDPVVLMSGNEVIKRNTEKMLRYFGPFRHIAAPGGKLDERTPPEAIITFMNTVRKFKHSEY